MDKFDRIFQIHSILSSRRTPVEPEILQARLECSRSTLYRLIGHMRTQLEAPIKFDTERGGFYYERTDAALIDADQTADECGRRRVIRSESLRPH